MPNKTILQLTGMRSTHYGAKERYFLEFARACRERGYQCVLQYERLPLSSAYLQALTEVGVNIILLPTRHSPFQAIPRIAALIHTIQPEIVETHFVNS